jgi:hypothetical protein
MKLKTYILRVSRQKIIIITKQNKIIIIITIIITLDIITSIDSQQMVSQMEMTP